MKGRGLKPQAGNSRLPEMSKGGGCHQSGSQLGRGPDHGGAATAHLPAP